MSRRSAPDTPAHHALPGDVLRLSVEMLDQGSGDTGHDLPPGFYVLCEQVKGGPDGTDDMLLLAAAGEPDDLGPWADPDQAGEMDAAVKAAKADGIELEADWSATWLTPVALLWSPGVYATGLRARV